MKLCVEYVPNSVHIIFGRLLTKRSGGPGGAGGLAPHGTVHIPCVRVSTFIKGYFDSSHYNFRALEIYHYNLAIWKFAIIIVEVADNCHYGRIQRPWAHL